MNAGEVIDLRECGSCGQRNVTTRQGRPRCTECRTTRAKGHATVRPEVIAPWAALARADGFPRATRGPVAVDWSGLLADRCADRLEAVDASARFAAMVLWDQHADVLIEAGKTPWFLGPAFVAQRSGEVTEEEREPCSRCRKRVLVLWEPDMVCTACLAASSPSEREA